MAYSNVLRPQFTVPIQILRQRFTSVSWTQTCWRIRPGIFTSSIFTSSNNLLMAIAPLWLWLVIELQAMLVEDFEYYAVYESDYMGLTVSFITFKPIEYACECICVRLILAIASFTDCTSNLWRNFVHSK